MYYVGCNLGTHIHSSYISHKGVNKTVVHVEVKYRGNYYLVNVDLLVQESSTICSPLE